MQGLFRFPKKEGTIQYVIGNGEFMHECFPKHSRMGTARMKKDKETDEEGKNRGVSTERSKAGTKKKVPTAYHITSCFFS